jgi:hypothetical protein
MIHTPAVFAPPRVRGKRRFSCMMLLDLSCRGHTLQHVLPPPPVGDFWRSSHSTTVSCYWHTASHCVHGFSFSYEMMAEDKGGDRQDSPRPCLPLCPSATAALDIKPLTRVGLLFQPQSKGKSRTRTTRGN